LANIGSLLEKTLLPERLHALRAIGQLAEVEHVANATAAYLVGGPTRDLMLGIAASDLDITVNAGGPEFAQVLATRLKGRVSQTSEFGTATVVTADNEQIDIAMTRKETYESPGALPDVASGSLDEDLRRRDFTINAMAVDLTPTGWGALSDPLRGQSDLVMRKLRVIHPNSFIDDPTRVFRAIRYATRLGFSIDPGTAELISTGNGHMDSVSPARVLAELVKMLDETTRIEALLAADEAGLLAAVHPALRLSKNAMDEMEKREWAPGGVARLADIALIGTALTGGEAESVVARLEPPSEWRDVLRAGDRFQKISAILDRDDLQASEIVELLAAFPVAALEAQYAIAPPLLRRDRLSAYLNDYRHVSPELDGDDLLGLGVLEGPAVGQLLRELRDARLDRKISSRFEEEALVKRYLRARPL
jgi:tRNA nucleotidyltransferase (CCA-adding enzyme)